MNDQLFYYKKDTGDKDRAITSISLQNAKISVLKPAPDKLKKSSMYKHCLLLENETRSYTLACMAQPDLVQWFNAIEL